MRKPVIIQELTAVVAGMVQVRANDALPELVLGLVLGMAGSKAR